MANNFWTAGFEPKRSHRWYLQFTDDSLGKLSFACKKVDKPSFKVTEITHQYLNHKFYYPGRLEWNPITITLANIMESDANATQIIHTITVEAGYQFPIKGAMQAQNNAFTLSKSRYNQLINQISIHQINSAGDTIEKWTLVNPIFTDIKFASGLSYENEDIVEMSFGVDYDYATLNVGLDVSAADPVRPL